MRRFLATVVGCALLISILPSQVARATRNDWVPVGGSIQSDSGSYLDGIRVDIDDAGDTVALLSFVEDEGPPSILLSVFDWEPSTRDWDQRGESLTFDMVAFLFGTDFEISSDGNTVAIGIPVDSVGMYPSGHVEVYDWDGNEWEPRDVIEPAPDDFFFGWSIALSGNGQTVVVGSLGSDDFDFMSGHVDVFDWDEVSGQWVDTDFPDLPGFLVGQTVAVDDDGTRVAASLFVPEDDGGAAVVIVDREISVWSDVADGFWVDQDSAALILPTGVTMSSDGRSVGVSALELSDEDAALSVRIFYDDDDDPGLWEQRGESFGALPLGVGGFDADDLFGIPFELFIILFTQLFSGITDLSSDGETLAMSQFSAFVSDDAAGQVNVYDWTGTDWDQRGSAIEPNGRGEDVYASLSVAIDGSGDRLVNGQINGLEGFGAGRVRVYEWGIVRGTSRPKNSFTFDPAGGTCSGKSDSWTETKRGSISLPTSETCSRPGYALLGWTRDPSQTTPEHLLRTVAARSGRLTAVWEAVPPAPSNLTALSNFGCDNCAVLAWRQPPSEAVATKFEVTVDGSPAACTPDIWGEWWVCSLSGIDLSVSHTFSVRGLGDNAAGEVATVSIP